MIAADVSLASMTLESRSIVDPVQSGDCLMTMPVASKIMPIGSGHF